MAKSHAQRLKEAEELRKQGRWDEVRGVQYRHYKQPHYVIVDEFGNTKTEDVKTPENLGYPAGGGPGDTDLAQVIDSTVDSTPQSNIAGSGGSSVVVGTNDTTDTGEHNSQ